jgi:hypothetical protein
MIHVNITRLKPDNHNQIMLHSAEPKLTITHVEFWLEVLISTKQTFSILVRDTNSFKQLTQKYPKLQILYAQRPIDVESVVNAQPHLKVVLFTSNMARNIHLLRFNHLRHIFIGTKNSEWLSHINKSYRAYDEFWTGGEFAVERIQHELENTGHLHFQIVGKPQLRTIPKHTEKKSSQDILLFIEDITESLLAKIYFSIQNLERKVYLYLDSSKKKIKSDLIHTLRVHNQTHNIQFFHDKNLLDEFTNHVGLVITDSKTLNPYLLSYHLPIVTYFENIQDQYNIDISPLRESIYPFSDSTMLLAILNKLIQEDELKRRREANTNKLFNQDALTKNIFSLSLNQLLLKK